ncbi:MAG: hypothetical protein ACJAWL_003033 [Motiliproteus sp.]|jgi:hypothetical protein
MSSAAGQRLYFSTKCIDPERNRVLVSCVVLRENLVKAMISDRKNHRHPNVELKK